MYRRPSTRLAYLAAFARHAQPPDVRQLRLLVSTLSVVLTVLVAVQTLDVLPCADEVGQSDAGHIDGSTTMADCLCHVTFTRVDALPALAAAPVAPPPVYAPFVVQPASADGPTVEHVPLA